MTNLDPAYCADGCGRLAETERKRWVQPDPPRGLRTTTEKPYLHVEQVCSDHATLEDR